MTLQNKSNSQVLSLYILWFFFCFSSSKALRMFGCMWSHRKSDIRLCEREGALSHSKQTTQHFLLYSLHTQFPTTTVEQPRKKILNLISRFVFCFCDSLCQLSNKYLNSSTTPTMIHLNKIYTTNTHLHFGKKFAICLQWKVNRFFICTHFTMV